MIKKLFILLLLAHTTFAGDNLVLRTGLGASRNTNSALYSLGYEDTFEENLLYKVDVGTWTDRNESRASSAYAAFLFGMGLGDFRSFNFRAAAGPAVIGYTDVLLKYNLELTEEATIGYKVFGVGYKHFGNAEIHHPNLGRHYFFLT